MENTCIIIPSRIGSTRLPKKPLCDINGKAMILHVVDCAIKTGIKDIYVATDNQEIFDAIESYGVKAIMTDAELPSGTDRINQAMELIGKKYDYIINLQGDMPQISAKLIKDTLDVIVKNGCDIATTVCKIHKQEDVLNPNIVKPVLSYNGSNVARAIYFSRSPSPWSKDMSGDYFHHIGLYVYKYESLKRFIQLPVSYLEEREKLEQLRAIENDMSIYALITDEVPISIDTQSDLDNARKVIK